MSTPVDVSGHLPGVILARLAWFDGGAPLIGTTRSLARASGVTVTEFLSAIRDLLEARRIVVEMEPNGRLSICLDDYRIAPSDRPV